MPNYKSHTNGSGKARSSLIAFGFFVFSVIALYLPDPSQDEVASVLRGSVLRPFILAQEGLVRRSIHAEDTEVLQQRLDSLEAVIANSSTLSEENGRLRRLLNLSNRNPAQYVAASVIRSGTPGSESMFMLDVGTRLGVTRDSPVIMGRGLLGVVREAHATRATAMDWTHPQFRVGAMTVDGSIYGMVQAAPGRFREADRLLLNGVPFHQAVGAGGGPGHEWFGGRLSPRDPDRRGDRGIGAHRRVGKDHTGCGRSCRLGKPHTSTCWCRRRVSSGIRTRGWKAAPWSQAPRRCPRSLPRAHPTRKLEHVGETPSAHLGRRGLPDPPAFRSPPELGSR